MGIPLKQGKKCNDTGGCVLDKITKQSFVVSIRSEGSQQHKLVACSKLLGVICRLFFVSTTLFIAPFFKKRGEKNGHP